MNSHRLFLIAKIALGAVILAGFTAITAIPFDPDLGWHLKTGDEILATHALPAPDHFSNTLPGTPWVDHEWITEAFLAWLSAHHAWWVATAVFSLCAFFPFIFWIARARNFTVLWLVFLSAASLTPFIGIRAQMISFVFFFFVFELLYHYFILDGKKKHLWPIPAILLIWVNLHAGFFIGLALFGMFIAGDAIAVYIRERRVDVARAFFPSALLGAGAALTLANPYGAQLYSFIFEHLASADIMRYISEFQPMFGYFNSAIIALSGIAIVLGAQLYRRYPFPILFVTGLFLAFSLKSARNWPLFIITAQPFFSAGIDYLSRDVLEAHKREPFLPKTIVFFRIAAAGMFAAALCFFGYKVVTYQGIMEPVQAVDFLNRQYTKDALHRTVLFNPYEWGGYLIWKIPDLKVFMDGRMAYWKTEDGHPLLADYLTFFKPDAKDREQLLKRYGITMILMRKTADPAAENTFWKTHIPENIQEKMRSLLLFRKIRDWTSDEPAPRIEESLLSQGWRIAYQDGLSIIFTK